MFLSSVFAIFPGIADEDSSKESLVLVVQLSLGLVEEISSASNEMSTLPELPKLATDTPESAILPSSCELLAFSPFNTST